MTTNRLCWMVGGPQGSGVDSAARLFALAAARGGLHLVGQREYYSNIKGEHSYYKIRCDDHVIRGPVNDVHLLATYDNETVCRHLQARAIARGGAVLYDPKMTKMTVEDVTFMDHRVKHAISEEFGRPEGEITIQDVLERARDEDGVLLFPFPYDELLHVIAEKLGMDDTARLQILKNTMATAASMGVLGYELENVHETLEMIFAGKKAKIIDMNKVAADVSAAYMQEQFPDFGYAMRSREKPKHRIFLQGTEAVGLAKMVAGCRVQTYYPISPATDESTFLESHPESGVAVVQVEDEIAAITMATGAALTGARASTSTSGPGLNLMVEGLGWVGICEVPLVVFDYMRGGPSTGLPTRTEQGDARFALHAGHGEFPRFVLLPGDLEEAFYDTVDAFNWAERYQTLVIVLPDKQLAGNSGTTEPFHVEDVRIDRGKLMTQDELGQNGSETFDRFEWAEDGISRRTVLGQKGGIHWLTGDEHTVVGHITEDPEIRDRMMEKRAAKMDQAMRDIPAERFVQLHGPANAELTILAWGSAKGPILDAMEQLNADGDRVNFVQIRVLSPFPTERVTELLGNANRILALESNYSGQVTGVVREHTGIAVDHLAVKYNGRPVTVDEVIEAVGQATDKGPERIVLRHGV